VAAGRVTQLDGPMMPEGGTLNASTDFKLFPSVVNIELQTFFLVES